jgi:hypothetical protein
MVFFKTPKYIHEKRKNKLINYSNKNIQVKVMNKKL